jgi:hypothetical protein
MYASMVIRAYFKCQINALKIDKIPLEMGGGVVLRDQREIVAYANPIFAPTVHFMKNSLFSRKILMQ